MHPETGSLILKSFSYLFPKDSYVTHGVCQLSRGVGSHSPAEGCLWMLFLPTPSHPLHLHFWLMISTTLTEKIEMGGRGFHRLQYPPSTPTPVLATGTGQALLLSEPHPCPHTLTSQVLLIQSPLCTCSLLSSLLGNSCWSTTYPT